MPQALVIIQFIPTAPHVNKSDIDKIVFNINKVIDLFK